MASRYGITSVELTRAATNINIGSGAADRMNSNQALLFIEEAERWAEAQVSAFIAVPLKPTVLPGEAFDVNSVTSRNYPQEFIYAIVYYALSKLLHSEYFGQEPNASEAGNWCLSEADSHIKDLRSRPTISVGSGRRRHPNPHMPPNIAPAETYERLT